MDPSEAVNDAEPGRQSIHQFWGDLLLQEILLPGKLHARSLHLFQSRYVREHPLAAAAQCRGLTAKCFARRKQIKIQGRNGLVGVAG